MAKVTENKESKSSAAQLCEVPSELDPEALRTVLAYATELKNIVISLHRKSQ